MKRVIILGSTGSIGQSALDVIKKMRGSVKVVGLSANRNVEKLAKQVEEFKPEIIALYDISKRSELERSLKRRGYYPRRILYGENGIIDLVRCDSSNFIISSMVGAVGLKPTIEAIKAGKNIALANKEVLVMAGGLVMSLAKKMGVNILPIDSEHSAILQCLQAWDRKFIKRIIITASGGPYRLTNRQALKNVTVSDTLRHPTWKMGPKITIDSATLINKGFEVIEAHHLFNIPFDRIDILLHPQSIVHSIVEFIDGSHLAQMSIPDMRIPIQLALTYPERMGNRISPLDLDRSSPLEFKKIRMSQFPCLKMALDAGKMGGTAPVVLNAANEVAVDSFLKDKIRFLDIDKIVRYTMLRHKMVSNPSLKTIIEYDQWARQTAFKKAVEYYQ